MIGMGYLYLAFAILSEVIATSFLKIASGPKSFGGPTPSSNSVA
jgi:multidrug transporter EmrE-like cation transporter